MTDRTLIITGGTGGLGTEVVSRLLLLDYRCVVLFHAEGGLDRLRQSIGDSERLEGLRADLENEESVRTAIRQAAELWGAPYALVHLAGGFAPGPLLSTTSAVWNQMLALNLTSAFVAIRETVSHMRRDQPGRILAISAEASMTRPANLAAYVIAKGGLNTLIELTARELQGTGITANALLPVALDTPAMRKSSPGVKGVPLACVADTIAFLLSDAGANVNGALIPMRA